MTIQERIEATRFYGCGDESYELFCQTCELCYKMYGLGEEDKALILCIWAEEMAEHSKVFMEDYFGGLDEIDVCPGEWG
jgi:hypothetical protein